MPVYRIIEEQHLNASLADVWRYFSHHNNLQHITPKHMNFRTTYCENVDEIYPGQIITYTVSPVLGIPLFWMTEITHVIPQKLFVDEQRRGPYSMWHHEHHFSASADGGTLMRDIIHYQLPLGPLGALAHLLFVKKQLADIFEYRKQQTALLFP